MNILPLIIIAIGSFCAGSFLVFKGYQQDQDIPQKKHEPDVVPISDPKEIDELKQNFVAASEPQDNNIAAAPGIDKIHNPDSSTQPESLPEQQIQRPVLSILQETPNEQDAELRHQLDQLKFRMKEQEVESNAKILELTEEKRKLEDALKREMDSKEPMTTGKEGETEVLEERLVQAESLIKSLTVENQSFNEHIQNQSDTILMLKNEIQDLQSKEPEPRDDLLELKAKAEKLLEAEGSVIRLMAENQRLTEQLHNQSEQITNLQAENNSYKNKAEEVSQIDPQVLLKMEEKLVEAQRTNAELMEENQRFIDQNQQHMDRISELNAETEDIRKRFEDIEAKEKIKMEAMQQELENQKQQIYEERQGDLAIIDKLRNEKQVFIEQDEQNKERINSLELKLKEMKTNFLEEVAQQKLLIKSENTAAIEQLNGQLENSLKTQAALDEQLHLLKNSYEQKINVLNAELDSIKNKAEISADISTGKDLVEKEKQVLLQELEELKAQCEKFSSTNEYLLEKEKMLVYELSKSRAQALGLERICKDFKRQLDQGSELSA